MGRTKIEINKKEFQQQIDLLEGSRDFKNFSALWDALCKTPWAMGLEKPLTPAIAYLRYKEFKCTSKTKPGKRGRGTMSPEQIAAMRAGRSGPRRSRSEKLSAFKSSYDQMRKTFDQGFHSLIARAQKGSLRAAIALECIGCAGQSRVEVKECTCTSCPLYPIRPYQKAIEDDGVPEEEVVNA